MLFPIITPSLISQVNAAAAADPIFSNLLQLAAAKTATEDQLQTLGLLIQSLAAIDHAKKIAAAASLPVSSVLPVNYNQPPPVQTPSKPFDLVIEFRETPVTVGSFHVAQYAPKDFQLLTV